jgi:hypothetical protein
MFEDRLLLIELDIEKTTLQASQLYLAIVTHNGDVDSPEYHQLKTKLADLQFERQLIQKLVNKGYP